MPTDFDQLKEALASRYDLIRELGSGGMATVYLAEDLRHQRKVAVKVLRADLAASLGSERFFREIQVAARLQHPHILPLLDSGEAAGRYYYVMPYVQGESLRERLEKHGELPIQEAVRILKEVVDALAEAHGNGVVHRDIKPDNVMLSGRHALVTDFGVAKAVSEATGAQKLTTAGIALGTPSYMAPEQAVADPQLDHRVDIYAVGVLGYEMLSGGPPFSGRSPQEILAAQVTQAPEPLAKRREAVPPVLEAVIMKCLEKRPADRWQTASGLLDQLEALSTTSAGITPTQTRPVAAVSAGSRQFPRWLAWALGGALVAGGALALSLRQRATPTIRLGQRTAIAATGEIEKWPALSPDGRILVYSANDRLAVQQVGGGSRVIVTTEFGGVAPAISPDGNSLFFGTVRGLYTMPVLGGQARQVVPGNLHDGMIMTGDWSPDGRQVVYRGGFDTLFVQSLDGSDRRVVATGRDLHSPAWSRDGKWIAYVEGNMVFHFNMNNAPSRIMVVRAEGGTPVAVTNSTAFYTSPIWIPGRNALLFISDKEGGRDIYQLELRGSDSPAGDAVRVTTGLSPERISLSADGKRLAWSVFTQTSNVWEVPVSSRDSIPLSRARQVTTGTQSVENVALSSDGVWLYYDTDRSGNPDIWRQRLDGGVPEQLTTDPSSDFNPVISPDGREMAFHSTRNGASNRDVFIMPAGGGQAVQVSTSSSDDRAPLWSRDGSALAWADFFTPDSGILVAQRGDDGRWATPRRYGRPGSGISNPSSWAPDGRLVIMENRGIFLFNLRTAEEEFVGRVHTPSSAFTAWSSDGRGMYLVDVVEGHVKVSLLSWPGKVFRTLAYADNPQSQVYRYNFAVHGSKVYLPLMESRSDVWVANIE